MDRWVGEVDEMSLMYDEISYAHNVILDLEEDNQELWLKVKQQEQIISERQHEWDYIDVILDENWLISTSSIADDYGMSAEGFNYILYISDIYDIICGEYVLVSDHFGKGYTSSGLVHYVDSNGNIKLKLDIHWTQKGRLFIYNTLKREDILPMIESER